MLQKGVLGKYWERNKAYGEVCIPFSLLKEYELDITHFLGIYDLKYSSFLQYFLEGIIPVDRVKILLGKVQQFLFNQKELVRSERIEVLKLILEESLDARNYEITSISLSTLLYTQKWVFHPDKGRQLEYNKLLLESLAETGDLEKCDVGFKLASKALATISQYEEDQKKHRENVGQAKAMKWLTIALIFVGLVQAGVTLYGIFQSGS